MDMRRHLKRFLNDAELQRLSGRYEGVIAAVVEEPLRNKFTAQKQLEPVIEFDDGWRLVPNLTMRRALIEFFGPETSGWVGKRIAVFRHAVTRRDSKSGATVTRYEKRVMKLDSDVAAVPRRQIG